jgi:3-oxoacyl-[acyl-carrier protein] reductase
MSVRRASKKTGNASPLPAGRFRGKVAVVTGASRGIGRATALALGKAGASVVLVGRDAQRLRSAEQELSRLGSRAVVVVADITRRAEVERLTREAYREFKAVHLLVNNAGVYPVTPFLEMAEAEWDAVLDTNLKGVFLTTQAIARRMVAQRVAGRIVNVSSTSSLVARPGCAHYATSKAGLNQLTRVLAVELAPHAITVNALCPGLIGTDRVQELSRINVAEHQTKLARIPMARLGTPEEIAAGILFLLSDEASYFTGSVHYADGGYTCGIPSYGPTATT